MPKLDLRDVLRDAKRNALVSHALANPDLTLAELVGLEGELGELAGTIRVEELQGASARAPGRRRTRRASSASPKRAGAGGSSVDTRTAEGRAAYDAKVLEAVTGQGEEIAAEELRPMVGGTAAQLRTALARLVDGKKLNRRGKARAVKYRLR